MTRTLRVAVIGAGLMGRRHALAYRSQPGVELAALADSDEATAAAAMRAFGVPCPLDWREALAVPGLDAASICLPDDLHREATEAALGRGLAVLLEKPIATALADAERIAALARGRTVLVGHMLRFDPRYQLARRAFREGRIGELVHAKSRRNSAVGAAPRYGASTTLVNHLGIHDIDLLQWATGRRVVEVVAHGASQRLAGSGHHDSVLVLGRFAGGAPFTMEVSWVLPGYFGLGLDAGLDLLGTEGRIEVHGLDQGLRIADRAALTFPDTARWVEYDDGSTGGILTAEIAHFVRAVRDGTPVGAGVEDALSALRVAAAVELSLGSGRPVEVEGNA